MKKLFFKFHIIIIMMMMMMSSFMLFFCNTIKAANFNISSGDVDGFIAAIKEANANGEADTIQLQAGIYSLTSPIYSSDGDNGCPSITTQIEITGAGAEKTIIERNSTNYFRIIHVGEMGNLTMNGLTLRNGGTYSQLGGGILSRGIVTLTHVTISENNAYYDPSIVNNLDQMTYAGKELAYYEEPLTNMYHLLYREELSNLTEETPPTYFAYGAGIQNKGGTMTLTNVSVSGNKVWGQSSWEGHGGGICNIQGLITMNNVTISDNGWGNGGGICNIEGELILNKVQVKDNITEWQSQTICGGIYNINGIMNLSEVLVSGNYSGVG